MWRLYKIDTLYSVKHYNGNTYYMAYTATYRTQLYYVKQYDTCLLCETPTLITQLYYVKQYHIGLDYII